MRLTLARALVLSVLLHLALSQALLAGILPGAGAADTGPPLLFRLVEPPEEPIPEPGSPGDAADRGPRGNVPERAALGGRLPGSGGGPAARTAARPVDTDGTGSPEEARPTPDATEAAAVVAPTTAGGQPGPGPAGATDVAELERRLEIESADLPEVSMGRLHPLLVRWARNPEGRRASSYRELLRTYIDVLMGHPYPVVDWLRRHPVRYLAELQVAVDADGGFRFTEIYFYPSLPDGDGRVRDYYRRLLRQVAGHPFLPPAEAGLPAPHRLTYRLLNPETR